MSSEHDFTGALEAWDERVFTNTEHFRLHRYKGRGSHDQAETKDFGECMRWAFAAKAEGFRVIVYSITASGRSCCLVENKWEQYAALWIKLQKSKRA